METSDLMIGDYVHAKTTDEQKIAKKIAQVYRVTDEFVVVVATDGSEYTGKKIDGVFGCVEPIPITAEILEKNGFVDNGVGQHYLKCGDGVTVRVGRSPFFNDGCWLVATDMEVEETITTTCVLFNAKYIHELQKVMRLAKVGKDIEL